MFIRLLNTQIYTKCKYTSKNRKHMPKNWLLKLFKPEHKISAAELAIKSEGQKQAPFIENF